MKLNLVYTEEVVIIMILLHPLASADAYLTPCIKKYISGFTAGFEKGIEVEYQITSCEYRVALFLSDYLSTSKISSSTLELQLSSMINNYLQLLSLNLSIKGLFLILLFNEYCKKKVL